MIQQFKELYDYRDFFFQFVYQQLHQRYSGSILGFLWTLINPLLVYASFSIIFSMINHWDLKDYGIYFFSGYMFWNFFANSCLQGAESVVGNPGYVTRLYVPRMVFPFASIAVNLVDLGAGMLVLFGLMAFLGTPFTAALLALPCFILIATIFAGGAALLCAACNVFLRDFRHLLSAVLFLWFFFSPVLWKLDGMPSQARGYLYNNPVLPFLTLFHDSIWRGHAPAASVILASCGLALVTLIAGVLVFAKKEKDFYYYL
jgi:ABC-type polysaccharide/polyol phosphate export permease